MENDVNINTLAQRFFEARGEETYCDLFGAVFALSQWHFIAVGEFPNLSPYCAVFPDFFDGQPMVLAFTDTERLRKYIAEKNLHFGSADQPITVNYDDAAVKMSSEDLILSIPTTAVIKYLEGLKTKGIKGVFFNPNKDSHGFPIGLPQLRETKELVDSKKIRLEPHKADEKADTLPVPTDFDALSRKSNESSGAMEDLNKLFSATFALEKWIFIARGELPNVNPYIAANAGYAGGQQMIRAFTDTVRLQRFAKENNLTAADGSAQMLEIPTAGIVDYLEKFIAHGVFGVWFNSDTVSDGYFVPLKQLRPIKEYLAKLGGNSVDGAAIGDHSNASTPPPSNLENWGLSAAPDGDVDLNIRFFRTGNVKYGTQLLPFYSSIVSLLADYQGSGEFEKIFNFAPEAIDNLKESFGSNTHGSYFRIRTFQYISPNAAADVTTIDSNRLRHIQTGATLLVSFALLNIPAGSSASLYFGFEGSKREVENLLHAVTPALEAAGFVASETNK